MRILLFVSLCATALAAQHPRDSWKLKTYAETSLSLADAPLASSERAQIYRVVDEATIRYSVRDAQNDKQREVVMKSLVGSISLALNGSEQVFVRGPNAFCGATGNCPIWIFLRQDGQLRPVLETLSNGLSVQKTSSKGFHDIATGQQYGALDTEYRDYRWSGAEYKQVDCYWTKYPRPDEPGGSSNGAQRPVIAECH
jgi:hypothetical protein